jgi:pimeloyl-ACP methyl ester carboxylesterase
MNEDGQKGEWEITIVGHSMGTIVANEIIRTYVNRGGDEKLPVRNVVYFAAATSLRDYEDTIFPFLEDDRNRQMYHLTLHRFSEVRDTVSFKIGGADVAPRGSLLVWIDNYLSSPNIPLDRTAGRFLNLITEVHETPPYLASQIHIREFDAGEAVRDQQPLHHGDFGAIFFWKEQCWKPSTSYAEGDCYCK